MKTGDDDDDGIGVDVEERKTKNLNPINLKASVIFGRYVSATARIIAIAMCTAGYREKTKWCRSKYDLRLMQVSALA